MKKINWHTVRLVLIIAMMTFLYAFSSKRNANRLLKEVKIEFSKGQENLFITHEMVNNLLKQNLQGALTIKKERVDLNSLENVLNEHDMIEKAEVFSTIDGSLSARIKQKTPIIRFVSGNESYYLDAKGSKMPLSENLSARVPLVVGALLENGKEKYLELFTEVANDDFLNKNITGFKILPSGSVIMTNRNYDFKIVFGRPVYVQKKLKNYKAFFYHAVKDTLLKNYKEVNVMFTEQVVCKK